MLSYLTILSIVALLVTFIVIFSVVKYSTPLSVLKCFLAGFVVMGFDFIIEFLGTTYGSWTYNQSLYFILGKIPIELLLLFFSAGVIANFIFLYLHKVKIPIRENIILYIFILVAFLAYVREVYLFKVTSLLPLASVVALWGIINIEYKNRASVILLAFLVAMVDLVVESIFTSFGIYSYAVGFNYTIPITYALLTIGLLGLLEKFHKLDTLFEVGFIKNILYFFKVYKIKIERAGKEAIKKLNGRLPKL